MNFRNCAAAAALVALNSFAQAELFDRGNGTVYDSTQDITWLKNWDVNGGQNLATQTAWADNLSVAGANAWALPSNSQYSGLFAEFGDLTKPSLPFANVQLYLPYWTSTEWEFGGDQGWRFWANDGDLNGINTSAPYGAVAVHDGDVSAIPEPETGAMMLVGFGIVMAALRRRPR